MKWNEEIKWKVTGLEQNVLIDYRVTKNFNCIHSQYHFLLHLSRHFHSNVLECCWVSLLHYQATGVTCSSSKTTGFLSMHANERHIYLIDQAHN